MQVLKRTGEELSQGQSRLKELVERMKREEEEVDRDTAILQQKKVVASLLRDFSSLTQSPFQSELETLQERAAEEEPLDPDEAVEVPHSAPHPTAQPKFFSSSTPTSQLNLNSSPPQAGAPLFRQLTTAYSEENAVEDALYFLGRALSNGALDCEGYLKQVLLGQTLKVFFNQLLGK